MEFVHKSVLLNESIEALNIKPDGIYVDGTAGRVIRVRLQNALQQAGLSRWTRIPTQ